MPWNYAEAKTWPRYFDCDKATFQGDVRRLTPDQTLVYPCGAANPNSENRHLLYLIVAPPCSHTTFAS